MSPSRLVGSYPTFSPLPRLNGAVVFFYVTPAVADTLHINKRDALCCPDFPHTPYGASDRLANCFHGCKINVNLVKCQICTGEYLKVGVFFLFCVLLRCGDKVDC